MKASRLGSSDHIPSYFNVQELPDLVMFMYPRGPKSDSKMMSCEWHGQVQVDEIMRESMYERMTLC